MTFVTAPSLIEQSDFSGGFAPDPENVGIAPHVLVDMLNLLPDDGGSNALMTRKGFKRLREELGGSASHYVKHIWPFRGDGTSYLICVLTDETEATNNVRLYAIDLDDGDVTRIDTADVEWENPTRNHWGLGIQEVFYGGSPGNGVYSWDPDGATWDATAEVGSWDTLVDSIAPGASEVARDFAFKGTEKVTYDSDVFTPAQGIRFKDWEDGQHYDKGEKVSRKAAIGSETYWRSYRCILAHASDTTDNAPGTGTDTATTWQKVRLPLPRNADGETSSKWYFVPVAPGTSVAMWHIDRLWMRYDGQGDKSRALFSAPVKPEKGADIPDVVFSMTDFAPGNDVRGPGGGWWPFNDGKKEGVLEAMYSYSGYGMFFKRQATWVLSGRSEESFTSRVLSRHIGAVGPECVAELNGLLYVLSDDGLYVTDGTAIEPAEGNDKVRDFIAARIDLMTSEGAAGNGRDPTLQAFDNKLWMTLPYENGAEETYEEHVTLVYDPSRAAFYKTDLPALVVQSARHFGVQQLYFAAPPSYGGGDLVYVYDHADAADQDDTGAAAYAAQDIPWSMRTAWWPFGLLREQRRIRRTWAVVKGALTYTLKAFSDWNNSTEEVDVDRVVAGTNATHIEGKWFKDSHAVAFELSGTEAPATVYGIAVDTEFRRERYHN